MKEHLLITMYNRLQYLRNTYPEFQDHHTSNEAWEDHDDSVYDTLVELKAECFKTSDADILSTSGDVYEWWHKYKGYDHEVLTFTPCTHRDDVIGDVVFTEGEYKTTLWKKSGEIVLRKLDVEQYRDLHTYEVDELHNLVYSMTKVRNLLIETCRTSWGL